jgi:hemerythrin-like metal-binding protein
MVIRPEANSPLEVFMTKLDVWKDDYLVGVDKIDQQHKILFEMLGTLLTLREDVGPIDERVAKLSALLERLNNYAVYHFRTEEFLIDRYLDGDNSVLAHKEAHSAYANSLQGFEGRFQSGDASVVNDLIDFIYNWWIGHIMATDKGLGKALNEAGVR